MVWRMFGVKRPSPRMKTLSILSLWLVLASGLTVSPWTHDRLERAQAELTDGDVERHVGDLF